MTTDSISNSVSEYVNNIPAGVTINNLPKFFLQGLAKTRAGKAALAYAEQHQGSFQGFEFVETTTSRRELPAGYRFCTDCYRSALAENKSDADAVLAATKPETDFGKIGKTDEGEVKYGSYCKPHTAARTKKYSAQVRDKQRLKNLPEIIANAQNRVLELQKELAILQARFNVVAEAEAEA